MKRVLIVDDEPAVRESLRMVLKTEWEVAGAGDVDAALVAMAESPPDLVLLDLVMPGRSGLELLTELAEQELAPPVVVLTATRTVATAVEAMKRGAADYVTKPFEVDELRIKIRRLLEHRELECEVAALRDEVGGRWRCGQLIGRSQRMQEVFRTVERVAKSNATVLVTGESGTGKELVARALHELGPRSAEPFVAISCAAIPETLIESELFGHERGAFTGANERRAGRFEEAHGGTIFFDEIGELSPPVQAKLLRALQEMRIERLGGGRSIEVDVRVVAATNRDLEAEIAAGRFRSDLFYRLDVVEVALPPLRERREDIRLLAENFLARAQREQGMGPERIAPNAMRVLERYDWPGNVREVENAIARAVALAGTGTLEVADLPEALVRARHQSALGQALEAGHLGFEKAVERFEGSLLRQALERNDWNQTHAAQELGLTRRVLKLKMDRYGLGAPF